MVIKIIDLNLFAKETRISLCYSSEKNYEYEVYAVIAAKKTKELLLDLGGFLHWCVPKKSIVFISSLNNPKWRYYTQYEYSANNERLYIDNVLCEPWMIENKSFFYDIIDSPDKAYKLFLEKLNSKEAINERDDLK